METLRIRSKHFSKTEIKVIEEYIQECNYDWIVTLDYTASSDKEKVDVTFSIDKDDLGEFLWLIFGCGHEYVYRSR